MEIKDAYTFSVKSIYSGTGIINGELNKEVKVNLPLKMHYSHGLITGVAGIYNTKTLQKFPESLSVTKTIESEVAGDLPGVLFGKRR